MHKISNHVLPTLTPVSLGSRWNDDIFQKHCGFQGNLISSSWLQRVRILVREPAIFAHCTVVLCILESKDQEKVLLKIMMKSTQMLQAEMVMSNVQG